MAAITRTGCASPAQAVARDTSSDETLIRRIAGGDQLAMRTLFARHRVAIYRWLLRIVHNETLAELSPEHGEVIDLVYYHGKSVKEVAGIVGVGEATVKTRMFYARKKLADLVATA